MITSYEVFVPALMGSGSSLRTGLKVRELGCNKVLVVYDKGLKDVGISDKIVENLNAAGIETICFDGVLPDPPDIMIEGAAEIAREGNIDGIVAVGGGSAIDTAKGINVLIHNQPPIAQYFGIRNDLRPGVPMVFLPTTSGTGSEVTNMCVITRMATGAKNSVTSRVCIGSIAILDPDLTLGLPSQITAATGFDAFCHAAEALTSGHENPLSDALARDAIRTISDYLPIAVTDGCNSIAREKMIIASMLAGMAFTNALVHLGHAFGHTIGARFHISHGIACAVALPQIIEFASVTESHKVRMIGECMDVEIAKDATPEEIGNLTSQAILKLKKDINMPTMKDLDFTLEDLLKIAPLVSQDLSFALSPRRMTTSQVAEILQVAYDAKG